MRHMKWLIAAATVSASFGALAQAADEELETAIFAGGCFWCVEEVFEQVDGVVSAVSGYIGGNVENPTYEQVSAGVTGHTEAVEIQYDPAVVTYEELLDVFWRNHDPTTPNRQFCDVGEQYRAGIFYLNPEQLEAAKASRLALEGTKPFNENIVTEVTAAQAFYRAEDYHQDYYSRNPVRYNYYKWSCGRAQRLEELWGPPS